MQDKETDRVERNDGWRREPFVQDEIAYMYDGFPDFSLVFLFLRLLCIGILYSLLHYTLCLVYLDCLFAFCFFSLPVGPHPPNGYKPTAEGGGICLLFISFCFVFCSLLNFCFCFVYIASMADGR
jgi:hypothetical protein